MAKVGRPVKKIKGGLSNEEKGRITYLLKTLGDSAESYIKISEDLDRPISSITKFIKEMKSIFVDTEKDINLNVKHGIINRVRINLVQSGVTKANADAKINKILARLSEEQQKQLTEIELFQACLRLTTASDLMINSSESGQSGISIMTPAAAERGDSMNKNAPPHNPAVFRIT